MSHYFIPWPLLRWTLRNFRKFLFSRQPSKQKYLVVDEDIAKIRRILGQNHFANSWELSYHYYGEDVNLRRPEYDESSDRPWRQLHIRGFIMSNGELKLLGHTELEPTEYPEGHLHNEDLSVRDGIFKLKKILDSEEIEYEEIGG